MNESNTILLNETELEPHWQMFVPKDNAIIIQLGANNGKNCDEYGITDVIHSQSHLAILVEPLKKIFVDLVINYDNAKSRIHFENIAIVHDVGTGQAKLFIEGVDGIESSLVRRKPTTDSYDVVRLENFQYLIDKYRLTEINAVFIDIEGLEYEVISDILLNCTVKPLMFRYEFTLSEYQQELDQILIDHGYVVKKDLTHGGDKIAVKRELYERFFIPEL